jgi:inhibitor of KinA sporulation pathway (predicted exonuclease)
MKYVIVDVEATCCNQNFFPRDEMEIIEIGSVAINSETFDLDDEYDCFIRPVILNW